jgi:methylglutaconyl-CoA hydratase
MPESLVNFAFDRGVARVVLNRPHKRNALTREFIEQLAAAVQRAAAEPSLRLLVLGSEGPVFCAGMDLGEMQQRATEPDATAEWQRDTEVYRDLVASLFSLPCPTLAVVQGAAVAGGVGLVAACDIVVAADTAFFALPEPKRGITPAVVAPLLIHRVGPGWAGYMMLSLQDISAVQAHRMGLCHEVVAPHELEKRAEELTGSILAGAPAALATTKRHLRELTAAKLFDQLDQSMLVSAQARETDAAREGLAAFLEKRPPHWVPQDT